MTINKYSGILYDAIIYNLIYFCKSVMYDSFKTYAEKDSDIFLYYNEFRNDKYAITPKDDFYPFFYIDYNRQSFLTYCFRKDFSFSTNTYSDFFNIFQNKKLLKRQIIYYYFEEHSEQLPVESLISGDIVAVTEAMSYLRYHGAKMKTFVRVFWDFDTLVDELVKYFEQLIHKLKIFHDKHKEVINASIKSFCSEENVIEFNRSKPRFKLNPKNQIFGVCLFNPFVYMCQYGEKDYNGFVIGCNAYVSSIALASYNHINHKVISQVFANEIMEDIVDALSVEELTITKLSMKLNVSRTTVDKFVRILYDELAIYVSNSIGNEKYYRVNSDFFIAGKKAFCKKIDNLIEINKK